MKFKQTFFRVVSFLLIIVLLSACGANLPPLAPQDSTPAPTVAATPVPLTGGQSSEPTAVVETPTTDTGMGSMGAGSPAATTGLQVKVTDQELSNGMVKVDDVVSSGPGWIVIYIITPSGQPGDPIGSAPVKDGDNRDVMVQVDATKIQADAQVPLMAMLHFDKGEPGKFEFPSPDVPVMDGVRMVASNFKVLPQGSANAPVGEMTPSVTRSGTTPAIIVASQPIVDGKVVLPEVISDGDAWVVIHKQNGDGTMGPMAGFAHIKDGVNKNVTVPVDTSLTSAIMYAMLHQNIAKKSSPEFPGADIPVMVNGAMIAPTFEITSSKDADVVINLGNTPETVSYLVDGHQMSLYISLRDTPGKSNCTAECLATWHPVYATGRIVAGTGVSQIKLGILLLPSGERQVTYLGAPLYLYSRDEKPGDVNGQGLDGSWYLVTP